MKKKRNLMAELTVGFVALADQRTGKRTLRTHVIQTRAAPKMSAKELSALRERILQRQGAAGYPNPVGALGWDRCCSDLEVLELPCNHSQILLEPEVLRMAAHIESLLSTGSA